MKNEKMKDEKNNKKNNYYSARVEHSSNRNVNRKRENKDMNLGYIFYKEIYSDINRNSFKEKYDKDIGVYELFFKPEDFKVGEQNFILKTKYPGLLTGSGYIHGTGEEDEFKLGFYFDYTSGLPIIPASSIKGTVRSIFKKLEYNNKDVKEEMKSITKEVNNEALKYLKGILCKFESLKGKEIHNKLLEQIESEIFEGKKYNSDSDNYENKSMYERDVFFDAALNIYDNKRKQILSEDYITPHGNPLKEPKPLKFLKIAPDVYIKFRFDLKNGDVINKNEKMQLIKQIILDFGIGAKTSVGYGYLEE